MSLPFPEVPFPEVTVPASSRAQVFLRYLEVPADPSKVGTEDMVFCTEVTGVL